jgi:hypothetical protein
LVRCDPMLLALTSLNCDVGTADSHVSCSMQQAAQPWERQKQLSEEGGPDIRPVVVAYQIVVVFVSVIAAPHKPRHGIALMQSTGVTVLITPSASTLGDSLVKPSSLVLPYEYTPMFADR